MKYIGELDEEKIGAYKDKLTTKLVIITDERVEHIKEKHPGDYEKYIELLPTIIRNTDYVLENKNNKDTILILKKINEKNKNIQIVIKLKTNQCNKNKYNSILTFWQMRDRNYISTIKNNAIIYKNMDNDE